MPRPVKCQRYFYHYAEDEQELVNVHLQHVIPHVHTSSREKYDNSENSRQLQQPEQLNSSPLPSLALSAEDACSSEEESFDSDKDRYASKNSKKEFVSLVDAMEDDECDKACALVYHHGIEILQSSPNVNIEGFSPALKELEDNTNEDTNEELPLSPWSLTSIFSSLLPSMIKTNADDLSATTSPFLCGRTCCIYDDSYQNTLDEHKTISDENMKTLADGTICNGWKVWNPVGDDIEVVELATEEAERTPNTLRNRSCQFLTRRRQRIEYLRYNLSPYQSDRSNTIHSTSQSSTSKAFCFDKRIYSFSIVNSNVLSPHSVASTCIPVSSCGVVSPGALDGSYWDVDQEDLFYDSDPGELITLRESSRTKLTIFPLNSFDDESSIKLVMNSNFTLVWHRESFEIGKSLGPIAVKLWVERGACIRSALLQPKLVWQIISDFDGTEDKNRSILRNQSSLNVVDLLDVTRILPMVDADKQNHPLAKSRSTFVIEALNKRLFFQARNENERNCVIHGLKLTIARLGSKIIVGDPEVFDEFFTPKGNEVPGDVPNVICTRSSK